MMDYTWYISEFAKNSKKLDLFPWKVKAVYFKWSH